MIRLSYPSGDLHKVHIIHEGAIVGAISYDSTFDKHMKKRMEARSLMRLEHLEELGTILMINFIYISDDYTGRGFCKEAIRLFEKDVASFGFKSLALVAPIGLDKPLLRYGYYMANRFGPEGQPVLRKEIV